jgi:DNA-binding NtrC family response regulator
MVDTIHVIHRDLEAARRYARWLAEAGWNTSIASERLHWPSSENQPLPSLVIGEAGVTKGDIESLVATARAHSPRCRVIALVSIGVPLAALTLSAGEATDEILSDPAEEEDLLVAAGRVLGSTQDVAQGETVPPVGCWLSPAARSAYEQARRISEHDRNVLLSGEIGTGKEHFARFIHQHSRRAHGPFFRINCAALSHEHAEVELFGNEAGAYPGARGRKRGRFELATWGTIMLDEVGELSPPLQVKLLAFLDARNHGRVVGERNVSVSARVIAATHRDLLADAERGGFRRDLYYRLATTPLRIPPLRERAEDIPQLACDLLATIRRELGFTTTVAIDAGAQAVLRRHTWPGNVRELRSVLERALLQTRGAIIQREHLEISAGRDAFEIVIRFPASGLNLHELTRDVARRVVAEALRRASSKQEAARLLGISRHALAHQIRVLGLEDSRPSGEFAIGATSFDPEEGLG